jgi:glycerol dehydrogenase-like iron-containing ADH family enzyme
MKYSKANENNVNKIKNTINPTGIDLLLGLGGGM